MERFEAAAKAGFKQVEFMFPYDYDLTEIKNQLTQNNLKLVLFNLPAGNWAAGDRGIAADPARRQEFRDGVAKAVQAAQYLQVNNVNCLVGKVEAQYGDGEVMDNLLANIGYAAGEFAKTGLNLLIEPVNHYDIPGFYLNTTTQVMEIIEKLGQQNIFLQYDIYHAEREAEDHLAIINTCFQMIKHIQVADNPGRNEPGTGTVDVRKLFALLDEAGYQGYIGLEYKPSANTLDSLNWVQNYGYAL